MLTNSQSTVPSHRPWLRVAFPARAESPYRLCPDPSTIPVSTNQTRTPSDSTVPRRALRILLNEFQSVSLGDSSNPNNQRLSRLKWVIPHRSPWVPSCLFRAFRVHEVPFLVPFLGVRRFQESPSNPSIKTVHIACDFGGVGVERKRSWCVVPDEGVHAVGAVEAFEFSYPFGVKLIVESTDQFACRRRNEDFATSRSRGDAGCLSNR